MRVPTQLDVRCTTCGWKPPKNMKQEPIQEHFRVEHDTDQATLGKRPICPCGAMMMLTDTRPQGYGKVRDYWTCAADGNESTSHRLT